VIFLRKLALGFELMAAMRIAESKPRPLEGINKFDRNQCLSESALQHIEPTYPAIEDTTLPEQSVEEHENWRGPAHQSDAIHSS
jgi:hypothetical protein